MNKSGYAVYEAKTFMKFQDDSRKVTICASQENQSISLMAYRNKGEFGMVFKELLAAFAAKYGIEELDGSDEIAFRP